MLPPLKSCPQRKGGTSPPCEVWLWEGIQRGASTKGEQSIDPLSLSLSLSVYFLIFCFSFLVPLTGLEQLLIWNLFGSCSYWKLALTRSVPDGFAALAHRIHKLVILVWQRIWQQFDIFIHIHLYSSIFIFSLVGGKLVKTKLQSLCRIESKMLRSSPRLHYSPLWTSSSQVWLWDFWHFWHFWPLRLLMKRSTCQHALLRKIGSTQFQSLQAICSLIPAGVLLSKLQEKLRCSDLLGKWGASCVTALGGSQSNHVKVKATSAHRWSTGPWLTMVHSRLIFYINDDGVSLVQCRCLAICPLCAPQTQADTARGWLERTRDGERWGAVRDQIRVSTSSEEY